MVQICGEPACQGPAASGNSLAFEA